MEKSLAKVSSIIFHPLLMTTLGMILIINSGSSLSVLQPQVKRVTIIVTALFTLVFPAAMIIMLYLIRTIKSIELSDPNERTLPITLSIIMYLFTFFIMRGIPQLTSGHVVFLFCPPLALFFALIINRFIKPSIYMLGVGLLLGVALILMIFYGARIQLIFIVITLVSGILGSARLILKLHTPKEVLAGFLCGFLSTITIMTLYIV